MNALAQIGRVAADGLSLPALVDRASAALANARSAAEILEARDFAAIAYTAAKTMGRLARAKKAHDELIAVAYRTQADALEIDAKAKRRLADEYDAAQERGDVQAQGGGNRPKSVEVAGDDFYARPIAGDIGLDKHQIREAREVRDAEDADPGIVRRTLDEALDEGKEPTRAKLKRAIKAKSRSKRHPRHNHNSSTETQHDRDLRMLIGVWGAACESARREFLKTVTQ
jgi:hypothetical protein